MKEYFKFIIYGATILAVLFGLAITAPYVQLTVMKWWGTEIESVKTDIYRENKSYVEGTIRDLRELQVEYVMADASHKDAIKSLILHRANELDWGRLPDDVREFLITLNKGA